MACCAWFVVRKIIRISKANRITSIADFVARRYGKSPLLGGLVTVIAVVGIIPYIALQLKAVSTSFTILLHYPAIVMPAGAERDPLLAGQRALRRAAAGRLHHPVRHAPYRRHRAPRGHGRGHRVRVAGEAASPSSPSASSSPTACSTALATSSARAAGVPATARAAAPSAARRRRLRATGASLTVLSMLVDPAPAAPVPGRGGRERRRAPPARAHLAVPAYLLADQPVRPADRPRRAAALRPGGSVDADTFVLTLPLAHGSAGAGAVRLHRRPVGGDRHAHRRDDRARRPWSATTWSCRCCCG